MEKRAVYPINIAKAVNRVNEYARFVKKHVRIGTAIKIRPERASKGEYSTLRLVDVQGQHFIFKSQTGWAQCYTMKQLCFDLANRNIEIIKEDTKNAKISDNR